MGGVMGVVEVVGAAGCRQLPRTGGRREEPADDAQTRAINAQPLHPAFLPEMPKLNSVHHKASASVSPRNFRRLIVVDGLTPRSFRCLIVQIYMVRETARLLTEL